jgi:hypothetical protein
VIEARINTLAPTAPQGLAHDHAGSIVLGESREHGFEARGPTVYPDRESVT